MIFLEIFNKNKFVLICITLFLYMLLNLLEGERGLISYLEKRETVKQLNKNKLIAIKQLNEIEKQNNLLTGVIDADYLEILYREKFMVGKKNEKIFIN